MSNNDQKKKLQPHQRPIWRKAFEASMQHTSIEAAERKAWHAVEIWERVGAFNESPSPMPESETEPDVSEDYEQVIAELVDWLNRLPPHFAIDSDALFDRLRVFHVGDSDPDVFRASLRTIYDV
jgi:hypothetical protein